MRQWLMAVGLYLVMAAVFYGFIALEERQRRRETRSEARSEASARGPRLRAGAREVRRDPD